MGGAKRYPSIAATALMGFAKAQPILRAAYLESPLPDDSIKAAARNTIKYLVYRHVGACPAIPDARAHIVAPHTALGLRLRDTPVVACLVAIGAFRQARRKATSLAF